MTASPRRSPIPKALMRAAAFLGAVVLLHTPAAGDSWMSPRTREVRSANGRFVAKVVPAGRGKDPARPHVSVRETGAPAGAAPLWEAELSNEVSPVDVMVSDDGRHVVTFDNWYAAGYGDDVVAFYTDGRQVAEYSLEQVLAPQEPTRVQRSVSSRWWRRDSIQLLTEMDRRPMLCVWLGPFGRWLAWHLPTGQRADVAAPDVRRHLNEVGRAWAVRRLGSGDENARDVDRDLDEERHGSRIAALRYLGTVREARDRPLLEAELASADFSTYTSFTGERGLECFGARSDTRAAADAALAAWDGREPAGGDGAFGTDTYVYLGIVNCRVQLGAPAARGYLWAYLIPEAVAPRQWAAARPVHWVRGDFTETAPAPKRWPRSVPVRFEGVTPGRYWVKVVYDRAAPFCDEERSAQPPVCRPGPGDFENTGGRVIEVKAGAVTDGGEVDCRAAVR